VRATDLDIASDSGSRPRVLLNALQRDLERFIDQLADERAREEAAEWLSDLARARTSTRELDQSTRDTFLHRFIQLCVRGRMQPLLSAYAIPHPSYNYFEDFRRNVAGPWDTVPDTWQVVSTSNWSVLGFETGFPVGVPASVLTSNADWVEYYARQGFNILTYKTVRSAAHDAHLAPNWIFLEGLNRPLSIGERPGQVEGDENTWPADPRSFSTANSFGVPSSDPEIWQPDVADAIQRLQSTQLLIVSVMGSPERYQGDAMVNDFVRVARLAEEAGAQAIELNLSCPNTVDPSVGSIKESLICESPSDTARIVGEVRRNLTREDTRLVVKCGHLPMKQLEEMLVPIGQEINAVSGINTLQMSVRRGDGSPTFVGTTDHPLLTREKAGVSGVAIREYGLDFTRSATAIIQRHGLDLQVIGMGGVMNAKDVEAYQEAGAAAVQTASAAFFNPYLPSELALGEAEVRVLETLKDAEVMDDLRIAGTAKLAPGTVRQALASLVQRGLVRHDLSEEGRRFSLTPEAQRQSA
jgi:dihydroorotate dehydrogenase